MPDPSLLSKNIWIQGALPTMGPFFGINSFKGMAYHQIKDVDPSYFPAKPILDSLQWQKISDYFYSEAPDYLPLQDKDVSKVKILPFFTVELPKSQSVFGKVSMTSYVKIDTTINPHRIIVNDAMAQKLYIFDKNLNILSSNTNNSLVTDIDFQNGQTLGCNIGETLEANNQRKGSVSLMSINKSGTVTIGEKIFSALARPVKVTHADLNNDGKMDYVISQFGNVIGDLSWMRNKGDDTYEKIILKNKPGAINTIIDDYNKDGLKDVWELFAQGDEGISVFTNKGNNIMEERQVLRFPPSYGSTSFDLVDFNHDGYKDIIYTCGDNADYTPILKPYHGVYIFLNDGKNNFTQKYFYPINGCYKAIARDFDGDGQIDIAAISFFPSSLQPEEAFTYLKNNGNFNFSPYKLPLGTPFEKGITMDVADLDGDGKLDILLGNGYYSSDESNKHIEPLFIVLKNKTQ
ncbi:VCBS repeat-containing protein [Pedobacter sp. SD-b]|uniref:VCBS repeat-containing protein n=1 Tax=Pedobacter segetis TaxID=2793069 RepID=A0ABS1BML4_9SPHI|nr:VCBS repeat-containing protein [Pedobacter segetis]